MVAQRTADRRRHPAEGDPIIVTPFFERPSASRELKVPAEIRTWNEDEDPLRLSPTSSVSAGSPPARSAIEETERFLDRKSAEAAAARRSIVSANPVVRAQRMIKSPAELALMQAAERHHARLASPRRRADERGMTPADIDAMMPRPQRRGRQYDGAWCCSARRRLSARQQASRTSSSAAKSC